MTVKTLEQLRIDISAIDDQLIELIAKRQQVALAIGEYKKQHNLPVFDQEREIQLKKFHEELSNKYNVASNLVAHVFEIVINASRKVQQ